METLVPESAPVVVGDGIRSGNAAWSFGGDTPRHFDTHVSRSVPGYAAGHDIVLAVSDHFIHDGSVGYELGCSTGTLARRLARRHPPGARWIGLDVEPAMIEQARRLHAAEEPERRIEFVVDDILTHEFEPADFIVAYYTMQFVRPSVRQQALDRIYQALKWGGAFLLFEKVRGPDARFQDIASGLYTDFKLAQGYQPAEVLAKSRSLKGVLEPFSTAGNLDLLRRAGFTDVMTIFKHICFEGFFCIK
jgi:tRNA (cmo5U34)-methyltransferase